MQTYKRAKNEMMENEAEERAKVERELMESRKWKMPFEPICITVFYPFAI